MGSFSESQLPILLDMSNFPIDDSEQSPCLLCGEQLYLLKLQQHLATQMEELA